MVQVFLLMCVALLSPSGEAQPQFVKTAVIDLNGDGVKERVSLSIAKYGLPYDFILKVGKEEVKGRLWEGVDGFQIVDIDNRDRYKEVAVHTAGPSDDFGYHVYWYDGKKIRDMGILNGGTRFRENGVVLVSTRAPSEFTFFVTEKFIPDKNTRILKRIPQEMYYLGESFTVKESFPIYRTRSRKIIVANLDPGSKAVLLTLYNPDTTPTRKPTGDSGKDEYNRMMDHWYLVKSQSGLLGWAQLKDFCRKVEGLPVAD